MSKTSSKGQALQDINVPVITKLNSKLRPSRQSRSRKSYTHFLPLKQVALHRKKSTALAKPKTTTLLVVLEDNTARQIIHRVIEIAKSELCLTCCTRSLSPFEGHKLILADTPNEDGVAAADDWLPSPPLSPTGSALVGARPVKKGRSRVKAATPTKTPGQRGKSTKAILTNEQTSDRADIDRDMAIKRSDRKSAKDPINFLHQKMEKFIRYQDEVGQGAADSSSSSDAEQLPLHQRLQLRRIAANLTPQPPKREVVHACFL